jgi:hypothetical protein
MRWSVAGTVKVWASAEMDWVAGIVFSFIVCGLGVCLGEKSENRNLLGCGLVECEFSLVLNVSRGAPIQPEPQDATNSQNS